MWSTWWVADGKDSGDTLQAASEAMGLPLQVATAAYRGANIGGARRRVIPFLLADGHAHRGAHSGACWLCNLNEVCLL